MLPLTDNSKKTRISRAASAIGLAVAMACFAPFAGAHEPPNKDSDSSMHGMAMSGMSMTGNADYDFAVNMRKHHQMALDMAQKELKNGKDAQLKQMATDIITSQTKEIASFDEWVKSHPQPMPKSN